MAGYRQVRDANGNMGWAKAIPFTYTTVLSPNALANGSSIAGQFTTSPGLPFILQELGCAVDADGATLTNFTNWGFTILDGDSQQNMTNGETPRERLFGTRDFPRQLSDEVELPPSDTITITAYNRTGAAATTNVRVTFTGLKLVGFTTTPPPR